MASPSTTIRVAGPGRLDGPWRNRLYTSRSLYLQQHGENPVDWREWSPGIFEEAHASDLPIFLSIGYSSCHWCHVMARESFSDAMVAERLNRDFIPVKVDREELPDVDDVYITELLRRTGEAGWPASLFLDHAGAMIYGGTYYPPDHRYGMPSFRSILQTITDMWESGRRSWTQEPLSADVTNGEGGGHQDIVKDYAESFDGQRGGWGQGIKFPMPPRIDYLLSCRGEGASKMAAIHLSAMDRGGIHDQIGGGFHRYATDPDWRVPHYEKMLCDNALIARAYLRHFALGGASRSLTVGCQTLEWMLREMMDSRGLFAASMDAEDPAGEGAFYQWSREDAEEALGTEVSRFNDLFQLPEHGSWTLARKGDVSLLTGIRGRLLEHRSRRPAPATDWKPVTSWNAMTMSALATGWRVAGVESYRNAAFNLAAAFSEQKRKNGRLSRRLDGQGPPPTLEDYAWAAAALLDLWEAAGREGDLQLAAELAEDALGMFVREGDPCMSTAEQAVLLPAESKPWTDHATHSPIGVFAQSLARLHLLGDSRFHPSQFENWMDRGGAEAPTLASAKEISARGRVFVVGGDRQQRIPFLELLRRKWRPHTIVCELSEESGLGCMEGKEKDGPGRVWICRGSTCGLPVEEKNRLPLD